MSKCLWCSMLAVIIGGTQQACGDDAKWSDDKLQGKWQAVEVVTNGESLPKETLERMSVEFSGEYLRIRLIDGDNKPRAVQTFLVNSSKKPKTIDVYQYGMTRRGIYEVDADTLKLCLSHGGKKERPTEFAAPKDSELILFRLRRVKE